MRAQEFITELFNPNSAFEIEWDQDYPGHATAHDRQGRTIEIALVDMGEGVLEIDFERGGRKDVTGGGDASIVFGTVIQALREYLGNNQHIRYLVFVPSDKETSRISLYNALVARFGKQNGFSVVNPADAPEEVTRGLPLQPNTTILARGLDEGWKNWLAGAGAAAMIAGGGGAAYDAYKNHQQEPQPAQQTQQVKQAPKVSQEQLQQAQSLLVSGPAKILANVAKANGIQGTELAQFMAQCAHETANFSTLKEFGGKLDFKKYDIKHNPQKAKLLGNVHPGDGYRYFGRGFIQLTGRDNYRRAGEALGLPLEKHPELAERPDVAAKIAVWFWQHRVQSQVNNFNDTRQATKPINSGLHGLQDRHTKFLAMNELIN